MARSLWLESQSGSPRQVHVVKNATPDVCSERSEGGQTPGLHGRQGEGATKDITEKEGRRTGPGRAMWVKGAGRPGRPREAPGGQGAAAAGRLQSQQGVAGHTPRAAADQAALSSGHSSAST